MKEILKMVQVREETHNKIKGQATIRRMSIKDYVDYLVEDDIESYKEEQIKEARKLLDGLENEKQ